MYSCLAQRVCRDVPQECLAKALKVEENPDKEVQGFELATYLTSLSAAQLKDLTWSGSRLGD